MRPASATTATLALVSVLALAGHASAITAPDLAPLLDPARESSDQTTHVAMQLVLGAGDQVIALGALFGERFDAGRALAERVVAESARPVNGCPTGAALPELRAPHATGDLRPDDDAARLAASATWWAGEPGAFAALEAWCRASQAAAEAGLGLPAPAPILLPDPPQVPELPELPALPAP